MPITVDMNALLHDLRVLVELESPSSDRQSVTRVMDVVETWMQDLGATSEHLPSDTRRFILSTPDNAGQAPVVLLAHADTVWPHGTLTHMPFKIEGERVYGPGTYDMKGGIVGALHALRALKGQLAHPVELLLTPDEEIGSYDSRGHIEDAARRAKAILVVEPPVANSNALKTGRKGNGMYHVQLHGIAAHAGNAPEQGASAIAEAARQLLNVETFAAREHGTTVSVGRIAGGGAINVIPAHAEFWVDVRVSELSEGQRIEQSFRALEAHDPRVRIEVSGGANRPPFERTPGTAMLYARAQQAARELGFEVSEAFVGGGSDGNFTAPLCPTLDGLGAPGDGAHAEHEHITLDAWPRHVQLLAELIRDPGV